MAPPDRPSRSAGDLPPIVIGCDTGGTFTDFVLAGPGGVRTWKAPSTPDDFARAVLAGARRLLSEEGQAASSAAANPSGAGDAAQDVELVHSSTVATNALLERKGARVALVTTGGFRDALAIGRQDRPVLYTLRVRVPPPLVPARRRFEVDERVGADGAVVQPLADADLERALDRVEASGARSVAVCLLFSFLAPEHERRIGAAARARGLAVALSSDVAPEFREVERTATTVAQAMVAPVVGRYVRRLAEGAGAAGIGRLRVVHSNGGSLSADAAEERAVETLLSGPAAGVLGALAVARQALGRSPRIVTFDMGGTSTDVALLDGALARAAEATVGGVPIRIPTLDVRTVGAGGGSIARLDAGGALRVGPESAGADPGPACYGQGGPATVTDANLLLGRIVADRFLGGRMALDVEASRAALERIGAGEEPERTAEGVVRVALAEMERAVRGVSVRRGHDPREFTLVSYGGAGGLHAAALAGLLGIGGVLVPRDPGVLSAWGAATADVVHEEARTVLRRDAATGPEAGAAAGRALAELADRARERLAGEGFAADSIALVREADLRYRGQSYELTVPWDDDPAALVRAFHAAHERSYGHATAEEPVEIVAVRLRAVGPVPEPEPAQIAASPRRAAPAGRSGPLDVYDRDDLGAGAELAGPALVVEPYATTFVPEGWRARVDRWGHLHLSRAP